MDAQEFADHIDPETEREEAARALAVDLGIDPGDTGAPGEAGEPERQEGPPGATWAEIAAELVPSVAEQVAPNWRDELTAIAGAWGAVLDKHWPNPTAGRYTEEIGALFVTLACVRAMAGKPPRGRVPETINQPPGEDPPRAPAPPPIDPTQPTQEGATVGSVRAGA